MISKLANDLRDNREFRQGVRPDTLCSMIYGRLDKTNGDVLVVLDEIEKLGGDEELLYEFPRANSMDELEHTRVGIIGISNNFKFRENRSQRVKSTLNKRNPVQALRRHETRTILAYYADLTF